MGNTRSECKHSVPVDREHATNNAKANGYIAGLLDKIGQRGDLYVCPHDSPVSYALMGRGVRIEQPARVGNIVCRHCRNPAGFEPKDEPKEAAL
jgi:hypothetical protein